MSNTQSLGGPQVALRPKGSMALESSRQFTNFPSNLYGINCFSTTAGYLVLLDAISVPANGAALVPNKIFSIPANGTLTYDWERPIRFSVGLLAVFSTTPLTYTPSTTAFFSAEYS